MTEQSDLVTHSTVSTSLVGHVAGASVAVLAKVLVGLQLAWFYVCPYLSTFAGIGNNKYGSKKKKERKMERKNTLSFHYHCQWL